MIAFIALLWIVSVPVQTNDRIQQTWKGPDTSAARELFKEDTSKAANTAVVKFTPAGDSGVIKALADALGSTPEEKAALVEAFTQFKQGYEAEAAKAGKANNLAVTMTFFIVSNVVAYQQTDMPSDADTIAMSQSMEQRMSRVPAFAAMSNADKQRMHDWLVCMAGFALTNYMSAKQNNDAQGLATIKQFADYSMRLALGIEASKLTLAGPRITMQADTASGASGASGAGAVNNKLIGSWTTAATAQYGGVMRLRYIFNADGSYSFKAERSSTSQRWWTTEESGTFTVNGDSLTITPKVSKATLRNLNGVVQETRANELEKVTYKWTTHFFEGIGETNLVLEPPQPTNRDGVLGSNSRFPKAYLYTQGDKLEWRF
ncbi:MAG TPA: lipocalin family protein [Pyrinomonadaceae bacterium]|nr:lipocalin family protein [Pyrinomonadaceae bacterium]